MHTFARIAAAQQVSFDAKRDRWLGYHPDEHKHTIDRFNKIDQERRRARREEAEKQEERRKARKASQREIDDIDMTHERHDLIRCFHHFFLKGLQHHFG